MGSWISGHGTSVVAYPVQELCPGFRELMKMRSTKKLSASFFALGIELLPCARLLDILNGTMDDPPSHMPLPLDHLTGVPVIAGEGRSECMN